ncbi:gliding motility-associated C-terminal domain-containing protein [Flagellimonas sp. S174]|uniref:T9SS type B sorting domain-containing protein n=1 Tax=Flagellimonas sp. S174 TaxID=3410790 RepID=UPI003BF503F6
MFRRLLVSLLFLLSFVSYAQTLIPDANFEQFLVDEGIDSNGLTGNILNADAIAVTNLNVTRNDIIDFAGLEAFTNLVTLNAGQNQVPTIPLTTLVLLEELRFARNTALATLDLTQNVALRVLEFNNDTAPPLLTTLDLSQNINLENLNVRTVRSITSLTLPVTATLTNISVANLSVPTIDLSQLTGDLNFRIIGSDVNVTIIYPNKRDALKALELSSIDFRTVDVSEMIGLERLGLFSTDVETLLLPSTTTLTRLTVWHHDFGSSLDLSPAPALTNLDIRFAKTAPLNIDLTNSAVLRDVWLTQNMMNAVDITQNPQLTSFRVYDNNLTSLDVTQNLNLNRLEANQNQLPGVDLSQNLDLQYLNLSQNQIPTLDVTNNTELLILDIGENLFTGTGLDLTQNVKLFSLTTDNNQIESLDITQNTELSSLNIAFNLFPGTAILEQFEDHIIADGRLRGALIANNNLLSGPLPDFLSLYDPAVQTRRFTLKIEENQFHFGDFEDQHLGLVNLTTTQSIGPSPDVVIREYTYAPQAKVNIIENPIRNAGESITLTTTVRGAQNHYRWFKDGVEITDAPDSPELVLNDLNTCDTGVYYAEITSDLVPFEDANPPGTNGKNLLLVRNDITLTVNATKDCVTLDMPLTDVPVNSGIQWNDNLGACGYKITIRNLDTGVTLLTEENVNEVTVYNYPSDFPPNTNIGVTITPIYDDGDFTGCVEQSFRTSSALVAPECTELLAPTDGDGNVAVDLSQITWNPANGADEYTVTVRSPSAANDITTTTTDTFLTFSNDFTPGEEVTVTIVPENTIDTASGCGPERFTIVSGMIIPTPPACTSLLSPTDGATDVAADLSEISWSAVPGVDGYRITINGSTSDLNDETDLVVTGTVHNFANDFDNGERVTVTIVPFIGAVDALGCTPESFDIIPAAPTAPACTSLLSPTDGATDVAVNLSEISWSAVPGVDGYRITINGSTSNLNDETDLVVTGTVHNFANDFDNGERVTVTIVPFIGAVDALGCTPESFDIIPAAPTAPVCTSLSNPINGAVDVPIDTLIEWDAVMNAEGYRIRVGTTEGGTEIFEGDVALLTSYDPEDNFLFATEIFVTITPYNSSGDAIGCSSETFITIEPPEIPEIPMEPDVDSLFGFSPDGDGINEYWEINGIENYPNNTVTIYNRWGDTVFKMEGYDNAANVFYGEANQLTGLGAGQLPEGTYFFQINIPEDHNLRITQGYVVLKR